MDTRVILHIGMHKTGTSAIQAYLSKNSNKLYDNFDILYVKSGREKSDDHHILAWTCVNRYAQRYNFQLSPRLWIAARKEIESLKPKVAIISSEYFWPAEIQEIAQIQRYFEGLDVKIVIYVRNHIQFALSAYQQVVKSGKYSESFDIYIRENLCFFDYEKYIIRWCAIFGSDNVKLRIYDKAKSNLLNDFSEASKLNIKDIENCKNQINISPSDSTVMFLLQLNKIERKIPKKYHLLTHKIRRHILTNRRSGPALNYIAKLIYTLPIIKPKHIKYLQDATTEMREKFLKEFVDPEDWKYFSFPGKRSID